MNKKSIFTIILVGISIALMVFVAETRYQHMPDVSRWARATGYGFSPWLFGLVPAGLWVAFRRLIKRSYDFRLALLWTTLPFSILWVASTAHYYSASVDRQNISHMTSTGDTTDVLEDVVELLENPGAERKVRHDAMHLWGNIARISNFAAYCYEHIEPNQGFLDVAQAWEEKHRLYIERVAAVVEATGGLSEYTRDLLHRSSVDVVQHEVERQTFKVEYCRLKLTQIHDGDFDLDKNDSDVQAFERIQEFQID